MQTYDAYDKRSIQRGEKKSAFRLILGGKHQDIYKISISGRSAYAHDSQHNFLFW